MRALVPCVPNDRVTDSSVTEWYLEDDDCISARGCIGMALSNADNEEPTGCRSIGLNNDVGDPKGSFLVGVPSIKIVG